MTALHARRRARPLPRPSTRRSPPRRSATRPGPTRRRSSRELLALLPPGRAAGRVGAPPARATARAAGSSRRRRSRWRATATGPGSNDALGRHRRPRRPGRRRTRARPRLGARAWCRCARRPAPTVPSGAGSPTTPTRPVPWVVADLSDQFQRNDPWPRDGGRAGRAAVGPGPLLPRRHRLGRPDRAGARARRGRPAARRGPHPAVVEPGRHARPAPGGREHRARLPPRPGDAARAGGRAARPAPAPAGPAGRPTSTAMAAIDPAADRRALLDDAAAIVLAGSAERDLALAVEPAVWSTVADERPGPARRARDLAGRAKAAPVPHRVAVREPGGGQRGAAGDDRAARRGRRPPRPARGRLDPRRRRPAGSTPRLDALDGAVAGHAQVLQTGRRHAGSGRRARPPARRARPGARRSGRA